MTCPACLQPLVAVKIERVDLNACRRCGGLWFPREELFQLATEATVREVLQAAGGKSGRCPACGTRLESGPACPKCERKAPTCPDCGHAPLSLGNVRGVNVDVCSHCSGIWLDPGELQLVAGRTAEVMRVQREAFKSTNVDESAGRVTCSTCHRRMAKVDAFEKDDLIYCGRCCPSGAAPMVRLAGALGCTVSLSGHAHDAVDSDADGLLELFNFFARLLR